MFTLDQIKAAHSKVKSGADFPRYVQDLVCLGVTGYSTYVGDGHTEYRGEGDYRIQSEARYAALEIADKSDAEQFGHYLKIHQQGKTGYPAFCGHSAETGVDKWIVDMTEMTCTYYDKGGNKMLTEAIPAP